MSLPPDPNAPGVTLDEAYQAIKASHNRMSAALPQFNRTNTYVGCLLDKIAQLEAELEKERRYRQLLVLAVLRSTGEQNIFPGA